MIVSRNSHHKIPSRVLEGWKINQWQPVIPMLVWHPLPSQLQEYGLEVKIHRIGNHLYCAEPLMEHADVHVLEANASICLCCLCPKFSLEVNFHFDAQVLHREEKNLLLSQPILNALQQALPEDNHRRTGLKGSDHYFCRVKRPMQVHRYNHCKKKHFYLGLKLH